MRPISKMFRFSPQVETLESRMQPGSILPFWATSDVSANLDTADTRSAGADLTSDLALVRKQDQNQDAGTITPAASTVTRVDHGTAGLTTAPVTGQISTNLPATSAGVAQSATQAIQTATAITSNAARQSQLNTGSHASARQSNLNTGKQALPAKLAHPATVASIQNLAGSVQQVHVTADITHFSGGRTNANVTFATLLGQPGTAKLSGIAVDAAGNSYVAGTADVGGTGTPHAFVAAFDGSGNPIWADALSGTGGTGTTPEAASGIAVDPTGATVYIAATLDDGNGDTTGAVIGLATADGTPGNGIGLANAQMTGLFIDSAGNIFASGSTTAANTAAQGGLVILNTDSGLNVNYAFLYQFQDTNGNITPSIPVSSQSVAADPAGDGFYSFQFQQVSGDWAGIVLAVDGTGAGVIFDVGLLNQQAATPSTPANLEGSFTGIIYSNGFIYGTGNSHDIHPGDGSETVDAHLYKVDSASGTNFTGFDWYVDDRSAGTPPNVGLWTGDGIALTGAAGNEPVVSGGAIDPVQYPPTDPPTQGVDVTITHFSATLDSTRLHSDGDPENTFGGTGDDYGHGLVYRSGVASVVGETTSLDGSFPVTNGSSPGAGPSDGFFAQVNVL